MRRRPRTHLKTQATSKPHQKMSRHRPRTLQERPREPQTSPKNAPTPPQEASEPARKPQNRARPKINVFGTKFQGCCSSLKNMFGSVLKLCWDVCSGCCSSEDRCGQERTPARSHGAWMGGNKEPTSAAMAHQPYNTPLLCFCPL